MENKIYHFAKFLGKKILTGDGMELKLTAVCEDNLVCQNRATKYILDPADCKIIINNRKEMMLHRLPTEMVVIRDKNGLITPEMNGHEMNIIESEILTTILACAGVTEEAMKNKTYRKRELVEARQLHMVIRNLVIRRNETVQETANVYEKNHATFLHAKNKIINALTGYDVRLREKYRDVFALLYSYYPEIAPAVFNLEWL